MEYFQPDLSIEDYKNVFANFKPIGIHNQSQANSISGQGYLVDYNKFQTLKNLVDEIYKKLPKDYYQKIIPNPNIINPHINSIKSQLLTTENIANIKYLIEKGQSFILIDENTCQFICKKNEAGNTNNRITYKIQDDYLIINPEMGDQLKFRSNKNNIIDKSSIIEVNGNNNATTAIPTQVPQIPADNWRKRYNDSLNYFTNEKDIITKLNSKTSQPFQGYLVEQRWIDKWKQYSYYNYIRNNFLEKSLTINENVIQNGIMEEHLRNKLNYDEVNNIDNFIIKDEKQMKEIVLPNKPTYVLLNETFLKEFPKSQITPIVFNLSNQNILKDFSNGETLVCQTNNNILNNPKIQTKIYHSYILQHLIRFYYFNKELKSPNNSFQNNCCPIFLVSSSIIDKFKESYTLMELIKSLENQKILEGVNYHNYDNQNIKIMQYLNEKRKDYINKIIPMEEKEKTTFSDKENIFEIKCVNNQRNLLYIDNFDMIDKKFADFLNQKFDKLIQFPGSFIKVKDKIFLTIVFNTSYIFEIVDVNQQNGKIVVDYLIQVLNMNNNTNIDSYVNSIYQFLIKNEIKNIRNPMAIGNNIILSFHPINKTFNQNLFPIPNENIGNINNNFNNNNFNQNIVKAPISPNVPINQIAGPLGDVKPNFTSRPLVGLENIGATCYMNSTVQCLCNITKFVNYFKYHDYIKEIVKNDTNNQKLTTAFKILIEELYPEKLSKNYLLQHPEAQTAINQKHHYAPRNFKDTISRMNPLF